MADPMAMGCSDLPAWERPTTTLSRPRRWRLWVGANVPVLSMLFRWKVYYGSAVVDLAVTERRAGKRASRFFEGNRNRWRAVVVQRASNGSGSQS